MSAADFTRVAHRRAVLAQLQRYLRDRYISSETRAPEQLICEDTFYMDRVVSQDTLLDILEELVDWEQEEKKDLSSYEIRRKERARQRSEAGRCAPGVDGDANPDQAVEAGSGPGAENLRSGGDG